MPETLPSSVDRKADHLSLTDRAQTLRETSYGDEFFYEPLFGIHPRSVEESLQWVEKNYSVQFLGKTMRAPLWVSSMTGGTEQAQLINQRLASVCQEFGLGMGLGSCRPYLDYPKAARADFDLRSFIGDQAPLFGNLGIAQIDECLKKKQTQKILDMVHDLRLDGLIVHLNPLQEWFQPEGDRFSRPAFEVLQELLANVELPIIVKEVGQGMGPRTLKALLEMPLVAIDFAAFGGTNFSVLELLRAKEQDKQAFVELAHVGHDAPSMVKFYREQSGPTSCLHPLVIISGGVQSYLDGYRLIELIQRPAVFGYAKRFLDHALQGEQALRKFVSSELVGLSMARQFLVPRELT
jgi:isopentenyl-diphosphate Delta-isomerase